MLRLSALTLTLSYLHLLPSASCSPLYPPSLPSPPAHPPPQLHVTISKTSVKVVLDCAPVGEKAVSAAGNITTDGVEILGRTVRSRGRRDNSAPVSLCLEPPGGPSEWGRGGVLIAATRTTHWLAIMKVRTVLQQSASLSYQSGNSLLLPQEPRPRLHPNTILSKLAGNHSALPSAAPVGVDCNGPSSIRGRRLEVSWCDKRLNC